MTHLHHIRFPALVFAALLVAQPAFAQSSNEQGTDESSSDVVLHEYFNPYDVTIPESRAGSEGGEGESEGGPAPSQYGSGAGQPPGLTLDTRSGDIILGPDGPAAGESVDAAYGPLTPSDSASQLDDRTDRVDEVNYHSVFDPSVYAYKRVVAQNQVVNDDGMHRLKTRGGSYRSVPVQGGSAKGNEESFWGSFLIRMEAGKHHPMPSTAPGQRILRVETEPNVDVRFFKDAADNFYVTSEQDALVRLNVLVAAPKFYFSGEFDASVGWSDLPGRNILELPDSVRSVSDEVRQTVGVTSAMGPSEAIEKMIYYFRNFEGKPFPGELKKGNQYRNIVESQIGVCRHRSLAFVMTAQAMNIPARYVYNEAHAFVEVFWPGRGWRRIDLGGAADRMGYSGEGNSRIHSASQNDPFPKPPRYLEEQQRHAEDDSSEAPEASSDAQANTPGGPQADSSEGAEGRNGPSSAPSVGENGAQQQLAEGGGSPDSLGEQAQQALEQSRQNALNQDGSQQRMQQMERGGGDQRDGSSRRKSTRLSLRAEGSEVYRGAELTLHGNLRTHDNQPVTGKPIKIYFGPVGATSPDQMELIAETETNQRGGFRQEITIPQDASIGRWSLKAYFEGGEEYRETLSE